MLAKAQLGGLSIMELASINEIRSPFDGLPLADFSSRGFHTLYTDLTSDHMSSGYESFEMVYER